MPRIYNTTDGPVPIDRAGRMLGGREARDVEKIDGTPIAPHVAAGRIVVRDEEGTPSRKAGRRTSTPTPEEA